MNVLFLGPPGSGKGTQSQLLVERFGLEHLSTGDMLRDAIQKQTEVGKRANEYMAKGEYVPDKVVIDLIHVRLTANDGKGFILDGFPRTVAQAKALDALLQFMRIKLDGVFFFNVANDVLVNRLSARRTCKNCGRIVSAEQVSAGKLENCKVTGAACDFFQRNDDLPDVIKNRIKVYTDQTTPVIEYYKSNPKFLTLDGALPADKVFQLLTDKLK